MIQDIESGDKKAQIFYVASLIEKQRFSSFDPARVAPKSIDTEIRAIYGEENMERVINLIIPQRSIAYLDSRKRSMKKIQEDMKWQSYQDCILNFIFNEKLLSNYLDTMLISIVQKGNENLPLEEINENENKVIIDEIRINRKEFEEIPSDFSLEFVAEIAKKYHQTKKNRETISQTPFLIDEEASIIGNGYIYILINPSMPGLVKIGKTSRESEKRADELSRSSGIPTPFIVAYEEEVTDCDLVEKIIHEKLEKYRLSTNREFFSLELKHAVKVVRDVKEVLETQ